LEAAAGADFYELERSTDGGASFLPLATLGAEATRHSDGSAEPGTRHGYRIRAGNGAGRSAWSGTAWVTTPPEEPPTAWVSRDVGAVGIPGSARLLAPGSFEVSGSGADIWNRADGFHFLHQTWEGDGEITAEVASMEPTDPWAKAGVMFRQSLAPDSANAAVVVTAQHPPGFQARSENGGLTTWSPSIQGHRWVKLVRRGSTFTGYTSSNGTDWRLAGSATVPMAGPVLVGLAVTSHQNSALQRAQFRQTALQR
jgi:regulation of enolase protein 1 (concanavalin A-like superfamily)